MTFRQVTYAGLSLIGLITIIVGLLAGGSPSYARKMRRDQERSEALSATHNDIGSFYLTEERLPTTDELRSRLTTGTVFSGLAPTASWELVKNDLVAGYRTTGTETYTLCLPFETSNRSESSRFSVQSEETPNFWEHDAKMTCYSARISSFLKNEVNARKLRSATGPTP